jgi:hypothetical protein
MSWFELLIQPDVCGSNEFGPLNCPGPDKGPKVRSFERHWSRTEGFKAHSDERLV